MTPTEPDADATTDGHGGDQVARRELTDAEAAAQGLLGGPEYSDVGQQPHTGLNDRNPSSANTGPSLTDASFARLAP